MHDNHHEQYMDNPLLFEQQQQSEYVTAQITHNV